MGASISTAELMRQEQEGLAESRRSLSTEELDRIAGLSSKPSVAGDIPAIVASAVAGFVPGLRESVATIPYNFPQRNALDLLPAYPYPVRQGAVLAANAGVDVANATLEGEAGPMRLGAGLVDDMRAAVWPGGKMGAPQIPKPFPTVAFPEAQTATGKGLALAAELTTGLLSGKAFSAMAEARDAARLNTARLREIRENLTAVKAASSETLAELDAAKRASAANITESYKGALASVDRAVVEFDQSFYSKGKGLIHEARTKSREWLRRQYQDYWNPRFDEAAMAEGPLNAVDQAALGTSLDNLVPPGKVNLTPVEAKIRKLARSMRPEIVEGEVAKVPEDRTVESLFGEFRKAFTGDPTYDDALTGKAKELMVDFLAERAKARGIPSPFLQVRSEYAGFAKFRDSLISNIGIYDNPNDTKTAVDRLASLVQAGSEIDPKRAKNVTDLQDFLREFRQIDSDLPDALGNVTTLRRKMLMDRAQMAAIGQAELKANAAEFNEVKREALETAEDTVSRLTKDIASAQDEASRQAAKSRLTRWLQRNVLKIGGTAALGAAGASGWQIAGRLLRSAEPPPTSAP